MYTLSINQKILISAFVGFTIGIGTVLIWNIDTKVKNSEKYQKEEKVITKEERTLTKKGFPVLSGETARVDIVNQEAGSYVRVSNVILEHSGWVAIHEDLNGKLGNVLGAYLFPEGVSRGSVELLRDTTPGNIYYAVLYSDNGDRAFELGVDSILIDKDQQPIMATFETI